MYSCSALVDSGVDYGRKGFVLPKTDVKSSTWWPATNGSSFIWPGILQALGLLPLSLPSTAPDALLLSLVVTNPPLSSLTTALHHPQLLLSQLSSFTTAFTIHHPQPKYPCLVGTKNQCWTTNREPLSEKKSMQLLYRIMVPYLIMVTACSLVLAYVSIGIVDVWGAWHHLQSRKAPYKSSCSQKDARLRECLRVLSMQVR